MSIMYKRNRKRRRLIARLAEGEVEAGSNPVLTPTKGDCNVLGCEVTTIMPLSGRCGPHTHPKLGKGWDNA